MESGETTGRRQRQAANYDIQDIAFGLPRFGGSAATHIREPFCNQPQKNPRSADSSNHRRRHPSTLIVTIIPSSQSRSHIRLLRDRLLSLCRAVESFGSIRFTVA